MTHAIIHADLLAHLKGNQWMAQNGFIPKAHAVLCDPPYALPGGFMSKDWDNFNTPQAFEKWVKEWSTLLIDFVRPGALLLAFGGTRTYHRLAAGLEDAGWDVVTGIEREAEYVDLARARVGWWAQFSTYDEARAAYEQGRKVKPAPVVIDLPDDKPVQIILFDEDAV